MPSHTSVNILLVDDKPERILSYEAALGGLGFNLIGVGSGLAALEQLISNEFAVILLDVNMPDMDGFETASLIRQHPRFEETPIIFITGVQMSYCDQRRGYALGAVDYVQIPVIPEILQGKVHALVQLYLQRMELTRLNRDLELSNAALASAHEKLKTENTRELQLLNQTLKQTNIDLVNTNKILMQEIAEREKAEGALNRASRRKDEYIAILAHELRNPLSAVHNAVQVIQLPEMTKQQFKWAQTLLQRQVEHLARLMDDLFDVSRISIGKIQLRLEQIDLMQVVELAVDTVTPILRQYNHQLKQNISEKHLYVNGDMVRLTQVLVNLLTNAAKFMKADGLIELSLVQQPQGWASIILRDYGVGIPKEMLDSLFDLFVQAPPDSMRTQSGLGIGLALAHKLIELHCGKISVISEGPNCGAEFTIQLPLIEQTALATNKKISSHFPVKNKINLHTVLIVDDNIDSAAGLAHCLRSDGHHILVSATGQSGINLAIEHRPQIIILDIGLPDMSGFEAAKKLRQISSTCKACIVALTGYSGKAQKKQAQEAGIDHYLVKPVDFRKLSKLINESVTKK